MSQKNYYGTEKSNAISYLEFGSINIAEGTKKIWNYWQDQNAYDLYMFARYARDLFSFRRFIKEERYDKDTLACVIKGAAHDKIMDYVMKYAGLLSCAPEGWICESGSSLYGWVEESIACDLTFNEGKNANKIKHLKYICSDISEMMNEGAKTLHPDLEMADTLAPTLSEVMEDITGNITDRLALFYGVSVSIRYAIRHSKDLIDIAKHSDLSVYNRLSLSLGDDVTTVYGSGKTVYITSLPELVELLEKNGLYAKFCTANMQREKDGKNTLRASVIISSTREKLSEFEDTYNDIISKCLDCDGVVNGEWLDISELK